MPASCAAIGCQNRKDKTRPDLVFKTIPTDERLNELWKLKIKGKKYPKDHNIVLCSEHFAKDYFERDFVNLSINLQKNFIESKMMPFLPYFLTQVACLLVYLQKIDQRKQLSEK